jgi:hypothetical protein
MTPALAISLAVNIALLLALAVQRVLLWSTEQELAEAREEIAELERVNAMIGMGQ